MKTNKNVSNYFKNFFLSILLLNLTLFLTGCSGDSVEDYEKLEFLASEKDEEPDPDNRKNFAASDKDEEPDPDNRD
ncbi:hypothetical protein ACFSTE_02520 [Aquimarina hainanensis]|uniref:Uncharacterized protein n=1 Tax=Aquimarina hainanensis TaxID=1578017 RepID=A0ABW5N3M1_9FLAO|nr:hypothetical protein [Aquimarina sp. TRL1]QKX04150.1 hypothetical protein HN014_04250 [Aquimarina sp. TRL1]